MNVIVLLWVTLQTLTNQTYRFYYIYNNNEKPFIDLVYKSKYN